MKKTLLLSAVALLVAACSEKENSPLPPPPGETTYEVVSLPTSTELALTKSNNDFSCRLFREILKHQDKPNVFISPLSASLALSMTTNGAAGITEKEMLSTLGFSDYSVDELNAYYQTLLQKLSVADPSVSLDIANSIWMRSDLVEAVNPLFLAVNQACYDADIYKDRFTVEAINEWCKEKTKGRIPVIIDQMSEDAAMYLINALYFKGTWKNVFDKDDTFNGYFTKKDGSYIETQMMRKMDTVCWASDETITAIELPYGNEAFNMTMILPQKNKTMDDAIAALTPENWKKWDEMFAAAPSNTKPIVGSLETRIVMPKFQIEWEMTLNGVLKAMGMSSAFRDDADFSNITTPSSLLISLIKQKTFVGVYEEGTEASAVTVVEMVDAVGPEVNPIPEMILDHPFLFAIREKASGAILFLGKVDEPKAK